MVKESRSTRYAVASLYERKDINQNYTYRIRILQNKVDDSFFHAHHKIFAHLICCREQYILPFLQFWRDKIMNTGKMRKPLIMAGDFLTASPNPEVS